jgi:hypothetical protein
VWRGEGGGGRGEKTCCAIHKSKGIVTQYSSLVLEAFQKLTILMIVKCIAAVSTIISRLKSSTQRICKTNTN